MAQWVAERAQAEAERVEELTGGVRVEYDEIQAAIDRTRASLRVMRGHA